MGDPGMAHLHKTSRSVQDAKLLLEEEPNHNSVDPNEANDNSSKPSVYSTRSHISVHSITSEPPQHPPDEENDIELPELETPVPAQCQSERVLVPPSKGGKTYVTNVQTETKENKDNDLVMEQESWQ